jgi:hypothetical protein
VSNYVSPEYTAVRHILTAPILAERCTKHIMDEDFAWDGLLAESEAMSGGQATMVRVALDLWSGERAISVWDLPQRLGPTAFDRVVEAMHLYRGEELPVAA